MQSNCAQQTLRVADQAFKSFFALLKLANEGKYDYKKIKMPKYRQKGGLFNYIIQGNSISIRDGYLAIPLSREYMALRGKEKIKIKVPERLIDKKICEVKIIPKYNGKYFKIAYCYEDGVEGLQLNQENTLAIDIGLDNLAACVTNTGTSFIMDGRKIKSIDQYWNKQRQNCKVSCPNRICTPQRKCKESQISEIIGLKTISKRQRDILSTIA